MLSRSQGEAATNLRSGWGSLFNWPGQPAAAAAHAHTRTDTHRDDTADSTIKTATSNQQQNKKTSLLWSYRVGGMNKTEKVVGGC